MTTTTKGLMTVVATIVLAVGASTAQAGHNYRSRGPRYGYAGYASPYYASACYAPGYYAPAPVYAAPAYSYHRPVTYAKPVYYSAPRYYAPAPVYRSYYAPARWGLGFGYGHGGHHGHGHHGGGFSFYIGG